MKIRLLIICFLTSLVVSSCTKDNISDEAKSFSIEGYAQKGPFINGAEVNVYELNDNLVATGRVFRATCDAQGHFELKNISLVSPYVEIVADGYYFDEVNGKISDGALKLKAFTEISSSSEINVNVMTNLEFERVKYLILNDKLDYNAAKSMAQQEILKLFRCDSLQLGNSESFDIINTGIGDGVLLAISSILQGNRTVSTLSQLQADIISDMKTDGELNDSVIVNSLIIQAKYLNIEGIKANIKKRYSDLGVDISSINDFEKYIKKFAPIDSGNFESPFVIPAKTEFGDNLLSLSRTDFVTSINYALAVEMPLEGKVKIVITRTEGDGVWWYQLGNTFGWQVGSFNNNSQTYTSTLNNETLNMPITFSGNAKAKIEYYYNSSLTPAYTKYVSWGISTKNNFEFRNDSPVGTNLLALPDSSHVKEGDYVVAIFNNVAYSESFKLFFPGSVNLSVNGGWGDYTHTLTPGQLEFNLKGEGSPCEIIVHLSGEGLINIESSIVVSGSSGGLIRHYFVEK